MKNLVLSAVVFVASSVSVFADTIINFADTSATRHVSAIASGTGTTIRSYTGVTPSGIGITFGGGINAVPVTSGFLTFSLASTGVATQVGGINIQSFAGDFKITSNANGTGTVYAESTGSALAGTILATNGATNVNLDLSASNMSGSLVNGLFGSPFGLSLNFANVTPSFGTTVIGGKRTIKSFTSFANGTLSGNVVPEPSTISLLGLGVAGLAFGAYRRRKAAAAV